MPRASRLLPVAALLLGTTTAVPSAPACATEPPKWVTLPREVVMSDPAVVALGRALDEAGAAAIAAGAPSAAVSVSWREFELFAKGFGAMTPGGQTPVDPERAVFRIASQTKILVTFMAFMLQERGALQLDDLVTKFQPKFAINSTFANSRTPTLRELATFSAALPREGCGPLGKGGTVSCDPYTISTLPGDVILETTARAPYVFAPNSRASYSNFGISLLANALEVAIARSPLAAQYANIRDFFRAEVALPLGMNSTSFDITPELRARFAMSPNTSDNNLWRFIDLGWNSGAGQAVSTATDLGRFHRYLLAASASGDAPYPRLLSANSLREYMRIVALLEDGVSGFGYAWETTALADRNAIAKGGSHPGYYSYSVVSARAGVAASAMVAGPASPNPIVNAAINNAVPALTALVSRALNATYAGVYTLVATQQLRQASAAPALRATGATTAATPAATDARTLDGLHAALMPAAAAGHAQLLSGAAANLTLTVQVTDSGQLVGVQSNQPQALIVFIPQGAPHSFRASLGSLDCLTASMLTDASAAHAPAQGLFDLIGTDLVVFDVPEFGKPALSATTPANRRTLVRTA